MGQVLLANNAYTTAGVGCLSGDLTITVASSSLFPAVTTASTNWFYACLQDTLANLEIVKVTNITGLVWTITRAQGGTTARAFAAGTVVELRVTAETINEVATANVTTSLQNSTLMYLTAVAGTVNAITATASAPFTVYAAGQTFRFIAAGANTSAVTININAVGAIAITKTGTTPLIAGDIPAGAIVVVIYDGTRFQLQAGLTAGQLAVPGPIGGTTPSTGAFTTLTSTGGAINGTVGATTPAAGAFTTLSATGAATMGAGLAVTGTLTANTIGAFTLAGTVAGGGNQLNNVIIGTTTPLAGSFTTLSATVADAVFGSSIIGATGKLRVSGYIDGTRGALLDSINLAENTYLPLTLNGSVLRLQTGAVTQATLDASGRLLVPNGTVVAPVAFASLPASPVTGQRAMINNSVAAPAFLSAAAGGGAVTVPVFYNGTAWLVG